MSREAVLPWSMVKVVRAGVVIGGLEEGREGLGEGGLEIGDWAPFTEVRLP